MDRVILCDLLSFLVDNYGLDRDSILELGVEAAEFSHSWGWGAPFRDGTPPYMLMIACLQ
jgi:hypothetical protein